MHPSTIELMRDQARAIYRALTGSELPEPEPEPEGELRGEEEEQTALQPEEVARRFAELESMVRNVPAVMERVPPFSFVPPFDEIEDEEELLFELAVPGIDRDDVTVERNGDLLVVAGVRRGPRGTNGRGYLHAEIPRGPFHRVIQLPAGIETEPRVEVERGLLRIHLSKESKTKSKTKTKEATKEATKQ